MKFFAADRLGMAFPGRDVYKINGDEARMDGRHNAEASRMRRGMSQGVMLRFRFRSHLGKLVMENEFCVARARAITHLGPGWSFQRLGPFVGGFRQTLLPGVRIEDDAAASFSRVAAPPSVN